MSGRNVNVFISDWSNDGVTVPVPRYSVNIEVHWTDADGEQRQHSDSYRFPNALTDVPLSRLRRYMEELILREARIQLGIDDEDVV